MKLKPDWKFSTKLKETRAAVGMSQAEFAKAIGTTQPHACHYETTARNPSMAVLRKMIVALDVDPYELLGIEK